MRIKVAVVLLLVSGVLLATNLLLENRTLTPPQLAHAKTSCLQCHPGVPGYQRAFAMHDVHAVLSCSRCHSDNRGLNAADNFHNILKWSGLGIMLLGVTTIIANFIVAGRRK